MTSYILVFAAQEIYAACVMIWNVLPPSRPPTVFRFSADQINIFVRCTFFRLSQSVGSASPSSRSGLCAVALQRVTITIGLFSG